jgi:hypothetical protein
MATLGDLTVVLNADEQRLVSGLKRAEQEANRTGSALLNALGSPSFGQAIGRASYGVQDFVAVLSQGGANSLSRAIGSVSNNIQQLGASFGPWGIAVGTAIGLGGQLAASLYESAAGMEALEKKTKDAADAFERLIARNRQGLEFEQKLRGLAEDGTPQQIQKEREAARNRIETIDNEIRMRRQKMQELTDQDVNFRAGGGGKNFFGFAEESIFERQMAEQQKEIDRLRDERRRFVGREGALGKLEGPAARREAETKAANELRETQKRIQREAEQDERRAFAEHEQRMRARFDLAKRIETETRTPQERYARRLGEINDLLRGGEITPQMAARAARKDLGDIAAVKSSQEALIEGSSSAISAITQARVRESQEKQLIDIQRQILQQLRDNGQATDELVRALQVEVVTIQ